MQPIGPRFSSPSGFGVPVRGNNIALLRMTLEISLYERTPRDYLIVRLPSVLQGELGQYRSNTPAFVFGRNERVSEGHRVAFADVRLDLARIPASIRVTPWTT